jgi:hypothetical protein
MEELSLSQMAVMTALNEMLSSSHFNICTIDKCADILRVPVKGNESYKILSALHCIDYAKIPQQLRGQIPSLIKECLGIEPMEILTEQEVKKAGFFQKLIGRV